jgi:putative ABC transport system permease protein
MLNAMLMSVMERTREIAVLRAVGWRRSRVAEMILGEGIALAVVGAIVGNVAAAIIMVLLRQFPMTSLFVPREISVNAIAVAVATVISAAFVGSLYPSLRAASTMPVESLRYE